MPTLAAPALARSWSQGRYSLGCILQHKLFSCSVKQSKELKTSLKLELPQHWDSENHKIIEFFSVGRDRGDLFNLLILHDGEMRGAAWREMKVGEGIWEVGPVLSAMLKSWNSGSR